MRVVVTVNQNRHLIIDFALTVNNNNTQICHGILHGGFSIENREVLLFGHFSFLYTGAAG
jgi:hypothetical protein